MVNPGGFELNSEYEREDSDDDLGIDCLEFDDDRFEKRRGPSVDSVSFSKITN